MRPSLRPLRNSFSSLLTKHLANLRLRLFNRPLHRTNKPPTPRRRPIIFPLNHHLPSPSLLLFWLRNLHASPSIRLLTWTLLLSPSLLFIPNNVMQIMWISGRSMWPFLNTDYNRRLGRDLVVVSLWRPSEGVRRGDVVAFWTPGDPERLAVKRVVGVEGDGVRGRKGGRRRLPGEEPREKKRSLEERQEKRGTKEVMTTVVPQGHIWVEGDNPESRFSYDSNDYGPIPRNLLVGKVVAGIWPRWAWVRAEDWAGSDRVAKGLVEYDDGPHKN